MSQYTNKSAAVAELFNKMAFDTPQLEMEGSLAQKYFEENEKVFGNENDFGNNYLIDTLGNKIYNDGEHTNNANASRNVENLCVFFTKLSVCVKENIQLLAELEYFIRGIPMTESKRHLSNLADLSELLAEHFTAVNCEDWRNNYFGLHRRYHMTNTSSVLLLFDVLYGLATIRRNSIYVDNNTGVLIHCFVGLLRQCGADDFLEVKGPYILEKKLDKVMHTSYNKGSSMIVYKTSDIDSAVDAVTRGAWSYRGFLPYALRRILVQESVWDQFLGKLSEKIKQFKWNFPDCYKADDRTVEMIRVVNSLQSHAFSQGQEFLPMNEVFLKVDNIQKFVKPLVLINEDPYFWENLPKDFPIPVMTLQPFRTSKEALLLLNKVPMKYLSVWCNNIAVCNELSLKVDVANVWVNAFGLYNHKIHLLENLNNILRSINVKCIDHKVTRCLMHDEAVKKVSKVHAQWSTWSLGKRLSTLSKVISHLEENVDEFPAICKSDFAKVIQLSKSHLTLSFWAPTFSNVVCQDNVMCTQFKSSLGIVCTKWRLPWSVYNIMCGALCGNAILVNGSDHLKICEIFLSFGVPVVGAYLEEFPVLYVYNQFCFGVQDAFIKSKNIWCTYGESFYDGKMLACAGDT